MHGCRDVAWSEAQQGLHGLQGERRLRSKVSIRMRSSAHFNINCRVWLSLRETVCKYTCRMTGGKTVHDPYNHTLHFWNVYTNKEPFSQSFKNTLVTDKDIATIKRATFLWDREGLWQGIKNGKIGTWLKLSSRYYNIGLMQVHKLF